MAPPRRPAAAALLAATVLAAAPLLASACTVSGMGGITVFAEPASGNLSAAAYKEEVRPEIEGGGRARRAPRAPTHPALGPWRPFRTTALPACHPPPTRALPLSPSPARTRSPS
jgi:hypothetical protein